MKILFVCKANVGRSQMAEAFFNKLNQNKENESWSAGAQVYEHEGETIGENKKAGFVVDVMNEEGIDVSDNVRNQLTSEMADDSDKIIMMADKELLPDFLKDSDKIVFWSVMDGKDTSYETHVQIRDEIKELVEKLIEKLG